MVLTAWQVLFKETGEKKPNKQTKGLSSQIAEKGVNTGLHLML